MRARINSGVWHLDVGSSLYGRYGYRNKESSSYYTLRELGSERCKSVWSISTTRLIYTIKGPVRKDRPLYCLTFKSIELESISD